MLDLYLLNETFTNGLNDVLLPFISPTSIFSLNDSIFSLGAFAGLDPNWDGTEIWLDFYFKDSISIRDNVLLASVSVSIGIISIIFLSAPNLELKIEAKEEAKLDQGENNRNNGSTLNLVHSDHLNSKGLPIPNSQFVWDKNDPAGIKLRSLLFPKTMKWYGNKYGAIIPHSGRGWDSNTRLVIADVPTSRIHRMITNGDSIQTNGNPALITYSENDLSKIHVQENI